MTEQAQVQTQPQALFTKNIQTKSNTYYFSVKEAKNGNQYLIITETRTKDGQQFRSSITVFGNNLQAFAEVFAEMAEKVKV